jgi:hypothetical protein
MAATKRPARQVPPRTRLETDDPDIKELHEEFDYATDAWRDIREEARIDMRYTAGDPWDPDDKAKREAAGRPALALDELSQYVNQIVNDIRQNKRAIKVTPLGNGANDQTAALRADLYRQIEYRSNAQQAYTTMFENAAQRSYGYLRINARYLSARSRHQELVIDPVMNPDLVTPDPDAIKPDLADMKYLYNEESWSQAEFKKKFPKASITDFTIEHQAQAPRWVKGERIMLAERWRLRTVPKKLLYVDVPAQILPGQPPQPARELDLLESEVLKKGLKAFGPGAQVVGSRMADMPEVTMQLTNGLEILDETAWPGIYIPFVGCFGKILYIDDGSGPTKIILSAIRLARDPQMLYCYYRTGEAEQVGMSTRFPYFVRQGSLSPEEAQKLTQSTHEPVAFIQVKSTSDDLPPGQMPEMPVRNPFEPAIQALEVGAEGARRAIQAAMGISPLPTSAQRRNDKSGVALKQIEESAQKGTFHFVDHYEASIQRAAVILDDLIPHYYDAARDLTVRKPDDTPVQVRVNDPNAQPDKSSSDYAAEGATPTLTEGDHDLTLSTGPDFESERDQANQFADTLIGGIQQIAQVAGAPAAAKLIALSIKLKNIGPLGTEMADLIAPPDADNIPPQAKAVIQQLQGQLQELQKKADPNIAKVQTAAHGDATKLQIAREDNQTKIVVAEIGAKIDAMVQQMVEDRALLREMAGLDHEAKQAARQALHDRMQQHHDSAHEVAMAAADHVRAKELADQQHQQSLEQQTTAAALEPPADETQGGA